MNLGSTFCPIDQDKLINHGDVGLGLKDRILVGIRPPAFELLLQSQMGHRDQLMSSWAGLSTLAVIPIITLLLLLLFLLLS